MYTVIFRGVNISLADYDYQKWLTKERDRVDVMFVNTGSSRDYEVYILVTYKTKE